MKTSLQDHSEGQFHRVKGKLKEIAGIIVGDAELEVAGKTERIAGKMQEKIGQIKKVFGK